MKYLGLLLANLRRKRLRTAFTLLSIGVAFVLFAYLAAIRTAFRMGIEVAGADRLMTLNKVSLIMPLPYAYLHQIAQVPGVREATYCGWFGATYQNPSRRFQLVPQFPVEPEAYLRFYPEIELPADQKRAWLEDRQGAVVGEATARRYGWRIGDRIPLQAPWTKQDGTRVWEFNLRGIYTASRKGVDRTLFLFHYDYLNEARARNRDTVGWYIVRVEDPARAGEVADGIDALFENSSAETETSTEKAFMQSFAKQVGDIGAIITGVLAAVFFTMLLVAGNTMAQAVRERTAEFAVLKTLGFTGRGVLALVLAESCLLAAMGGAAGLALGWFLVSFFGDPTNGALQAFYIPLRQWLLGVALIALLGVGTGALPAAQAMRLAIVDALRRV